MEINGRKTMSRFQKIHSGYRSKVLDKKFIKYEYYDDEKSLPLP